MAEAKGEIKRTPKVPGVVTCAYCDGTGKQENITCIVCGGREK